MLRLKQQLMGSGEKVKVSTQKKKNSIMGLLKPYRWLVFLLIVFALLSNGANLVIPKIISHGIDSFTAENYQFKTIVTQFLAAAVFIFIFSFLQMVVQTYASEKVGFDLRKKLSDKISMQSFAFIQESNPSKLLTNLTSDIDSVKSFVSQAVTSIISSAFIIIGTSVLLLTINWKLALPVLLIIPLVGVTFYMVARKIKVLYTRSREVVDWLNKVINESIIGSAIIRVLNSQQTEYRKFLAASLPYLLR